MSWAFGTQWVFDDQTYSLTLSTIPPADNEFLLLETAPDNARPLSPPPEMKPCDLDRIQINDDLPMESEGKDEAMEWRVSENFYKVWIDFFQTVSRVR